MAAAAALRRGAAAPPTSVLRAAALRCLGGGGDLRVTTVQPPPSSASGGRLVGADFGVTSDIGGKHDTQGYDTNFRLQRRLLYCPEAAIALASSDGPRTGLGDSAYQLHQKLLR